MSKFRNDIQGLRGLCMIIIFIYHYNKCYIPSGLLGVDIFFIISGYVNTLSITAKQNIYYTNFFCKRILRLLPISFLGLLYSIVVICKSVLFPYRNKQYKDVFSCSVSFSNYRFYSLSINYVMKSESKSIVLHYWSLSVEDQFYILFPLLFYNNHGSIILLILIIQSYIYSIYIYNYHYSLLYFSTLCRVWEFLFGSFLITINRRIKFQMNIIILLLILSIFFIKELEHYVPLCSILPLFLVSFILISYDNNTKVLSNNILVVLGNLSYPFYIFHYIILFRYVNNTRNIIILFIATILISYLLNEIIKLIMKNREICKVVIITIYISSIIVIYFIINIMIRRNNEILHKNFKIKYTYIQVMNEWNKFFRNVCKCQYFSSLKINNIQENVVLLLMDSHGEQWSSIFIPYIRKLNYILLEIYYLDRKICNRKYRYLDKLFSKYHFFPYIIISQFVRCTANNSYIFTEYLSYLQNYTNEIFIIQDTPHFIFNPLDCIYSNNDKTYCYGIIGINSTINKFPLILHNKIKYIDMNKYICENNNKCNFIINNIPVYKDHNHLTLQFSKSLEKYFLEYLKLKRNSRIINVRCNYEYRCVDYF